MTLTSTDIRTAHDNAPADDRPDRPVLSTVYPVADGALYLTALRGRRPTGTAERSYYINLARRQPDGGVTIGALTRPDGTRIVLTGATAARWEARRFADLLSQPDGMMRLRAIFTGTADKPIPPLDLERRWHITVGIRYRAARQAAGLSLEELAGRVGDTPRRLDTVEKGRSNDLRLHLRVAAELREDVGALLAGHPGQAGDPERAWHAAVGSRFLAARNLAELGLEPLAWIIGSTSERLRALEGGRSDDLLLHIRTAHALRADLGGLFDDHPAKPTGMWFMMW